MFQKGEYVVYGSRGVCLIQDISPIEIPGADPERPYYIMQPVYHSNGTVYLPADSEKAVLRRVMSAAEAEALLAEIPEIAPLCVTEEKKRELTYKEALKSCSVRSWVSMIKALHLRKGERLAAGKKVTALDDRYLRAAEHELCGELAVVLGASRAEVEARVYERIS